ncbi:hypothetical protein MASR2M12_07620 [Bacteroidales bacterium]
MIYIFTEANDEPSTRVINALNKYETEVLRVNLDKNYVGFSFSIDGLHEPGMKILYEGIERIIKPNDVFWFRRGNLGSYLFLRNEEKLKFIDFIADEKRALEVFLTKVFMENHYCLGNANLHNIGKLEVLLAAKSIGLPIPKSIVTYDRAVLVETGISKFVCKPFCDVLIMDSENCIYHSFVEEYKVADLQEYFGNSFFQESIDFEYEIRLLCVERKIYAVKSVHKKRGHIDTRHPSNTEVHYNKFVLNELVQQAIFRLCESLQTNFAVIDFLVSKEGALWFTDFNPCGQYDEIFEYCYPDVNDFIANLLYEKGINK